MNLFSDEGLTPRLFTTELIDATEAFGSVVTAAARTVSPAIESTHFLMALAAVPDSVAREVFGRAGFSPRQLDSGLAACAERDDDQLPPVAIIPDKVDDSAREGLEEAARLAEQWEQPRIGEGALLVAMLRNLTPRARESLGRYVDLDAIIEEVVLEAGPAPEHEPAFVPEEATVEKQRVNPAAFSPSGRRVLEVMVREANGLGADEVDARHLLLACLVSPGETLRLALHQQKVKPQRVHEGLLMTLKRRAGDAEGSLQLQGADIQPVVRGILEKAVGMAARERATGASERHLLLAFIDTETLARRLLLEYEMNPEKAIEFIEQYEVSEEIEETTPAESDIAAVRARLTEAVMGQPEAVDQCFRYIRRILLGYQTPGRPAGVFLFCGESGTGKTELAKAMADAIYGSREALVFLEMGQYQTRESMNMLVGAPHGYVGFGDGKLTNALRDDPRRVVLFDEFEKAAREVYDAVLRFLDEGRIEDPAGPVREGQQAIVILTSNRGRQLGQMWEGVPEGREGHWEIRRRLRNKLVQLGFRPELLNRIDEIILFRDLEDDVLGSIAEREMQGCVDWIRERLGVEVELDDDLGEMIGEFCSRSKEGARIAQRVARTVVLDSVFDCVLGAADDGPVHVRVSAKPGDDGQPWGTAQVVEPPGEAEEVDQADERSR
jgi:ATP-dependent Clp protease ATP-binding subunit ClpC